MQTNYKPIACHFYDELEALAVKKVKSKIVFTQNEMTKEIEDFIVDFKTLNKEEFMILSSGLEIRLDKIISVNDSKPLATC
jgi:Rho-binding antiterminator